MLSCAGLNSGTFLVRNTDASRSMMEAFNAFGSFPANRSVDEARPSNHNKVAIGPATPHNAVYVPAG